MHAFRTMAISLSFSSPFLFRICSIPCTSRGPFLFRICSIPCASRGPFLFRLCSIVFTLRGPFLFRLCFVVPLGLNLIRVSSFIDIRTHELYYCTISRAPRYAIILPPPALHTFVSGQKPTAPPPPPRLSFWKFPCTEYVNMGYYKSDMDFLYPYWVFGKLFH